MNVGMFSKKTVSNIMHLLAIIELGGYPNLVPLYERLGYKVKTVNSVRKALSAIRQEKPNVIVTEFNFQSDFRDRTSSLETLLAVIQQRSPDTRIIVLYDQEYAHQFDIICKRFSIHASFTFPINETELANAIDETY